MWTKGEARYCKNNRVKEAEKAISMAQLADSAYIHEILAIYEKGDTNYPLSVMSVSKKQQSFTILNLLTR